MLHYLFSILSILVAPQNIHQAGIEGHFVLLTSDFEVSSEAVCLNQTVTVNYTGTAGSTATFNWSFDGGTIISGNPMGRGPIEVSWDEAGSKTITLTVTEGTTTFPSEMATVVVSLLPRTTLPIQTICRGDSIAFQDTFLTVPGVYSDTLLSVNQCDSIVTQELLVEDYPIYQLDTTICVGDTVFFNGLPFDSTVTYFDTISITGICDSIVALNLTVIPVADTMVSRFICSGDSVLIGDTYYSNPGNYIDTLQGVYNCDSIVRLTLDLIQVSKDSIVTSICFGDSIALGDRYFRGRGIYRDTFQAQSGCDSIVILDLDIIPQSFSMIDTTVCSGDSVLFGGQYYDRQVLVEDTLTTSLGCDSIITFRLIVRPPETVEQFSTICEGDSLFFAGQHLKSGGTYRDTSANEMGCDSITILNLTVAKPTFSTIKPFICEGDTLEFRGVDYFEAGTYADTLQTVAGCDSILQLELGIFQRYYSAVDSICAGDTLIFGPKLITRAGLFRDTFETISPCDSIVSLRVKIVDEFNFDIPFEICRGDTLQLNDLTVTQPGVYRDTIISARCDTFYQWRVNYKPPVRDTFMQTICFGETVTFGGNNYQSAGFYSDTIMPMVGCDQINTFALTVRPLIDTMLTTTLCEGDTLFFDNLPITRAGTYIDTLTSIESGCDSIFRLEVSLLPTLRDTVNAVICSGDSILFGRQYYDMEGYYADTLIADNLCDSISVLNVRVLDLVTTNLNRQICSGDSTFFGGMFRMMAGIYRDTLTGINTCDSIVQLDLTLVSNFRTMLQDTICIGDTLLFGDSLITAEGMYFDTLQSTAGCDSIIQLDLRTRSIVERFQSTFICEGTSITFNDTLRTEAGIFRDTLIGMGTCDTIATLSLSILPTIRDTQQINICANEFFLFDNEMLTTPGYYSDTLMAMNGCDSIATILLDTLPIAFTDLDVSICQNENYTFAGELLTETGVYSDTLTTINQCDSIVTLTLSVLDIAVTTIDTMICEGTVLTIGTNEMTTTGILIDTLIGQNGCDSIVQVDLTVNERFDTTIARTICLGDTLMVGDSALMAMGTYQFAYRNRSGCDSLITYEVMVNEPSIDTLFIERCVGEVFQYSDSLMAESGFYDFTFINQQGCDSIITVALSISLPDTTLLSAQICDGESYEVGDSIFQSAGIHHAIISSNGVCDSIVQVDLTIAPTIDTLWKVRQCVGDTLFYQGDTLLQSGQYEYRYPSVNNCDSIVTIELTLDTIPITEQMAQICRGEEFIFGDTTLTDTGIYLQKYNSQQGCDSLVYMLLTVIDSIETNLEILACDGDTYQFGDLAITESGVYQTRGLNDIGCDSITNLLIEFTVPDTTFIDTTICAGTTIVFGDQEFNSSGRYVETFSNEIGCDSTVIFSLSVQSSMQDTLDIFLCAGESYVFGGDTLRSGGLYTDTTQITESCPLITVLQLTIQQEFIGQSLDTIICPGQVITFGGQQITSAGLYQDTVANLSDGCDTIRTLVVAEYNLQEAMVLNDTAVCTDNIFIQGNLPTGTTGRWTISNGANILNDDAGNTFIENLPFGITEITWTLSTDACPNYSSTQQSIGYWGFSPDAEDDIYVAQVDQNAFSARVTLNDDQNGLVDWRTSLVNPPEVGQIEFFDNGLFTYNWMGFTAPVTFTYVLENIACPMFSDTAQVRISFGGSNIEITDQLGISPNGDGINEFLVFQEIEAGPQLYPDNEIMVFNRWGDLVYSAKPYNNDWDGRNEKGELLPSGTYYFYLKLDMLNGLEKSGVVMILR